MSLRVDKDNIYAVIPNNKYNSFENIGNFMEKDFTIFIRAKIKKEGLNPSEESFLFARNGQHCGISMILDKDNDIFINFSYWFKPSIISQVTYKLPKECEDVYNNYIILCDMELKTFIFYVNDIKAGTIDFSEYEKVEYSNSFIWLGCGNMIATNYKCIGDFMYELLILMDKNIPFDVIDEIYKNFNPKYIDIENDYGIPTLNDKIPFKENFKMFCDFNNMNRFKIWNMIDNGNYLQKYLKNNIYF